MIRLTLYSRPGCHLCDDMKVVVARVGSSIPLALDEIDISTDERLEELYGVEIPVLLLEGKKVAKYRVNEPDLRRILAERIASTKTNGTP